MANFKLGRVWKATKGEPKLGIRFDQSGHPLRKKLIKKTRVKVGKRVK